MSTYLSFARRLDARGDPVDVVLLKPLQDVFAPYRELRDAMLLHRRRGADRWRRWSGRSSAAAPRVPIGELVLAAQRIEKGALPDRGARRRRR